MTNIPRNTLIYTKWISKIMARKKKNYYPNHTRPDALCFMSIQQYRRENSWERYDFDKIYL